MITAASARPVSEVEKDSVKAAMDAVLFDPYSAVYKFEPEARCARINPESEGRIIGAKWYGYVATVSINAKNRMGGYVGAQTFLALLKDDGSGTFKVLSPDLQSDRGKGFGAGLVPTLVFYSCR
jgi:hypothetical protein